MGQIPSPLSPRAISCPPNRLQGKAINLSEGPLNPSRGSGEQG